MRTLLVPSCALVLSIAPALTACAVASRSEPEDRSDAVETSPPPAGATTPGTSSGSGGPSQGSSSSPSGSVPSASQPPLPDEPSGPVSSPPPASASWWHPAPGTTWQVQYTGTLDTSLSVQVYNIDLFDTPATTIAALHGAGRKVMCYFSAGSFEDWRPDAASFPAATLGGPLDDWPGEKWLDVRQVDLLRPIMTARLDIAKQKGCDGVDPDNMDGYGNNTTLPLTAAHQLAYNRMIADEAHARGLGVGLKNDLDQIPELVSLFDWAVNEQCIEYGECDTLLPFIQAGKAVFGIEYKGNAASLCGQANGRNFDTLFKKVDLDAYRKACR